MNKRLYITLLRRLRDLSPRWYLLFHPKVHISVFIIFGGYLTATEIGNSDGITRTTLIGQRDTITLADCSILDLNGDTSILIQSNARETQVFLGKGEMRASGRHDRTKPLRIVVGHVMLEVIGTQFDVARHEGVSTVSVTEGKVRLYERRDDGSLANPITIGESGVHRDPIVLLVGDAVRLEEHGGTVLASRGRRDLLTAENRTAWLQGEFIADKRRLDEVFWQFEAYNDIHILTDDPTITTTEIGGIYHLNKVEDFLAVVGPALDLKVTLVRGDHGLPPTYLLHRNPSKSPP